MSASASDPRARLTRALVLVVLGAALLTAPVFLLAEELDRAHVLRVLASNGVQALELVAQMPAEIHLVITALVMPGMSGRELMDRLRLRAPGIPLVCMSGYSHGDLAGAGTYLRKPFTTQELLRKVREALFAGAGSATG